MESLSPYLSYVYLGHEVRTYMTALFLFIAIFLSFYIFQHQVLTYVRKLAKKTKSTMDDLIVSVFDTIPNFTYFFVSLYIALQLFHLPDSIATGLFIFLAILLTHQVVRITDVVLVETNKKLMNRGQGTKSALGLIRFLGKMTLYTIGFLLILSNLGIDITSLVTGLGIGGIAVALAVQNILGDLFSYFAIHMDHPFSEGDFVSVNGTSGTIKKVGVRTTRIKALEGEEVVVSNKEITSSQIQNFKKLRKRRVKHVISVTYDTKATTLKKIPALLESCFAGIEEIEFERAHMCMMGASSIDFEVVFYVNNQDYRLYMDVQQAFLLNLKATFDKAKIEFAFPTQTIHIAK